MTPGIFTPRSIWSRMPDIAMVAMGWIIGIVGLLLPISIVAYLVYHGAGAISWSFITDPPRGFPLGTKGGIKPAIMGSLALGGLGLLFAFPLALAVSIYLAEFSRSRRLNACICFANECFASLPSIVFGIFGYGFLVVFLKLKMSLLAGSLTIAIMMLPIIMVGSFSAIKAVDWRYREAALSLGTTRWYVFRRVVLPLAWPGILSSTVLATGYAVGAAAPVLFTASIYFSRGNMRLNSPVMTLPTHLYYLVGESISLSQAYATAALLLSGLLCFNGFALLLRRWGAKSQ